MPIKYAACLPKSFPYNATNGKAISLFFGVGDEDDEESYVELSYEFNAETGRHEIWSDNPTSASAHIMYQIEQQLNDGTTLDAE